MDIKAPTLRPLGVYLHLKLLAYKWDLLFIQLFGYLVLYKSLWVVPKLTKVNTQVVQKVGSQCGTKVDHTTHMWSKNMNIKNMNIIILYLS